MINDYTSTSLSECRALDFSDVWSALRWIQMFSFFKRVCLRPRVLGHTHSLSHTRAHTLTFSHTHSNATPQTISLQSSRASNNSMERRVAIWPFLKTISQK